MEAESELLGATIPPEALQKGAQLEEDGMAVSLSLSTEILVLFMFIFMLMLMLSMLLTAAEPFS